MVPPDLDGSESPVVSRSRSFNRPASMSSRPGDRPCLSRGSSMPGRSCWGSMDSASYGTGMNDTNGRLFPAVLRMRHCASRASIGRRSAPRARTRASGTPSFRDVRDDPEATSLARCLLIAGHLGFIEPREAGVETRGLNPHAVKVRGLCRDLSPPLEACFSASRPTSPLASWLPVWLAVGGMPSR